MTTESGSDSESKDQDQEQKGNSDQQGAAAGAKSKEQQQQQEEDHQNALEQFSAVAAHSTPVKKEQQASLSMWWDVVNCKHPL